MGIDASASLIRDLVARLSAVADEFESRADRGVAANTPRDEPASCRRVVQTMLEQRAARHRHFPADLFQEPAWDMMLALFIAHQDLVTLNVKALVSCSLAPATTSQRWIDHLHRLKLVNRVADPNDRRRTEISLSDAGNQAMQAYCKDIAEHVRP